MYRFLSQPARSSYLFRRSRLESVLVGFLGLLPWAAVWVGLGLAASPVQAGGRRAKAVAVTPPTGVGFDANLSYCQRRDVDFCLDLLPLRGGCVVACKCAVKDCDLRLNVAYPKKGKGPFPAVVLIHGGGWFYGSSFDFVPFSLRLAERGYVAVTVSYRFVPANRFPDQVHDVKCAVRWLRAHADRYRVDPERIGAFGHSAGGSLACLLGMAGGQDKLEGDRGFKEQRSDVCCVVCTSGLTDLAHLWANPTPGWPGIGTKMVVQGFLGGPPSKAGKRYELASPITYACKASPPTLLICGTKDALVPNEQSRRLEKKLRAAGATVRLLTLEGAEHDFFGAYRERSEAAALEFFERYLKSGKVLSPR
jgi:acetyl esterase/lipase